jgi:hypothetical protein
MPVRFPATSANAQRVVQRTVCVQQCFSSFGHEFRAHKMPKYGHLLVSDQFGRDLVKYQAIWEANVVSCSISKRLVNEPSEKFNLKQIAINCSKVVSSSGT